MKNILPLLIALLFAAAPVFAQFDAEFESYIENRLNAERSPGMSIALIDEQGNITFKNYGFTDYSYTTEPSQNTIYEIGSITKTFTGALFSILMDEYGFTEETTIQELIGDRVKIPTYDDQKITVKQMLTHHSGLPRLPHNIAPANLNDPYKEYSNQNMFDFLNSYELPRAPGSEYEYSNLGFMIMGHLAEIITGTDYDTLIKQYFTDELEMHYTSRLLANQDALAQPTAGGLPANVWSMENTRGYGELFSTTEDMLTYLKVFMGQKEHSHQDALLNCLPMRQKVSDEFGYGLSWMIRTAHEDTIIFHGGGSGGFRAFAGFSAVSNRAVVVLINSNDDVADIGRHLINPEFPIKEIPQILVVPAEQLAKYEGRYVAEGLPAFTVYVNDDALYGQMDGQGALILQASEEHHFFNSSVNARIVFEAEGGVSNSFVLHQMRQQITFVRQDEVPQLPGKAQLKLTKEEFEEYLGTYIGPSGLRYVITTNGQQLEARLGLQPATEVYPETKNKFYYTLVDARLVFERNDKDEVIRLTLQQGGQVLVFEKSE